MLDAIINVLIEKLVESLKNEASHVLEFHKQFKAVNQELQLMQSYIKRVEKMRRKDHKEPLKTVVGQFRELLYDAEDIISDCVLFFNSERRKRASKFRRYCSPSFWKFRYRMGKKLGEINQEIRNHRERMGFYLPTNSVLLNEEHLANNQPLRYPDLVNDAEIVGLDYDAKKIKHWVLKTHVSLNIIGIVGMGGIGKTTLAQKIHNDGDVKNHFDHVLMVTVSQTFKFEDSIKNMLKSISEPRDLANIDLYDQLKELQQLLEGKKCLVILDDVWRPDEGSWWNSLKSILPQRTSCVIVTTRNEDVALSMGATQTCIHHSQLLSDVDSWLLFSKIAFATEGGQCLDPKLEHIGREIVDRCGGLPLAIKVVGGMMISKGSSTSEWGKISKTLKEELDKKGEPIISVLELSYDELPSHLKPCMLCLAVFPEDHKILSFEIIAWWIGEGFVRGRENSRSAYEVGKEYLDELISRCLLLHEHVEKLGSNFYLFKVHDLVREMIRRIAMEENFICIGNEGGGQSYSIQARRVGMVSNMDWNFFSEEMNFKSLRTVTGIDVQESEEFVQNMGSKLCQFKRLRVLNICFQGSSEPPAVDWLSGKGSLQHLVSLVIQNSGLERLPDSIGNLQSLQILCISDCPNLKRLPKNLGSLDKLSILVLPGCWSIECLPREIENLQQLSMFSFSLNSIVRDGFQFSSLKKLTQLRQLFLDIDKVDKIEEGELKVLSELTQLVCLAINFSRSSSDDQLLLSKKVDYELPPLHQLSDLFLYTYPGQRAPVWLNPTSLPNLRNLVIFEGNIAHLNPGFFGGNEEEVWKLELLILQELYELEEEWPRMQRAIPYLKFLRVMECPKLTLLPYEVDQDGTCTWRKEEE